MSTKWKIPAHQPYSFVMRSPDGLDVWLNNVTGYYEDWLPGRNPLESGTYAGEAAP